MFHKSNTMEFIKIKVLFKYYLKHGLIVSNKSISWRRGRKHKKTLQRLYRKLRYLKEIYYTDNWKASAKVLPFDRHVVGKEYTSQVESNNDNTRHQLSRMTHRSKVTSKFVTIIPLTMKVWHYYSSNTNFTCFRDLFFSIF